jgi:glutamate-1-semialdehyde 2,1-aminomutase
VNKLDLKTEKSEKLFSEARKLIPGGVNSPVRAFKSVGGKPLFIKRASGSRIQDVDDNELIDYVGSWGPMILGHAHPEIIEAIKGAANHGTSFGAPTAMENKLAELIIQAVPSIEKVRLVNSGTEAAMSAIRLARGFTGKDKIIKFSGCYHGHADYLLVKAGSGATTLGIPDSAGVPSAFAELTVNLPYNDSEAVKSVLEKEGNQIAAIILEPVAGNMGVIPPRDGYLQELRQLADRYEVILIFDEVITGFRVAYGGCQELYGVKPDLTVLGKIIGGGLPVGAYGGRKEIMDYLAPDGSVYQAGTLSGNPLAVAAGVATLKCLADRDIYRRLNETASRLAEGLQAAAEKTETFFTRVGSMLCTFFQAGPVHDFAGAARSDTAKYANYFSKMLQEGIYFAPSQFETVFVSTAHSQQDVDQTIKAAQNVFASL